jgi:hypothetical protein
MPKVTVCDLVVREREVDVPSKCPRCGADLTFPGSMKVWEFQDQCRPAHFDDAEQEGLNWGDCLPSSGETFMPVEFQCKECEHTLLHNEELTITGEDETRGFEVLIAAAKRGRKVG